VRLLRALTAAEVFRFVHDDNEYSSQLAEVKLARESSFAAAAPPSID
jgi:hypothetical protein